MHPAPFLGYKIRNNMISREKYYTLYVKLKKSTYICYITNICIRSRCFIVPKYHLVSISMSYKLEQSLFHKRFHVFIMYPNFALHKNYAFYYTSSFCRLFIASAECNSFCICTKIKNKLYTMRNLLIGYCMKD